MHMPLVVIILLNWNDREQTLACLHSIERLEYPNFNVVIVDNNSVDDSIAAIRHNYPWVKVVENNENRGFVDASNQGLDLARKNDASYSWLLNNDTEVAQDALDLLVEVAEAYPDSAVLGPTIYYFDKPETIWSAGGSIDWSTGRCEMIGLDHVDTYQYGIMPRPVDFVSGCALLVRTKVIDEVGELDSKFFAYYEETEWCVRMARAGYRIYHVPLAKVWHKIKVRDREISPTVHYYMTRNRLLFLQSVQAPWRAWLHTLVLEYLRTLMSWSIRPKWHDMRQQRNIMVRAIIDFFRGRTGKLDLS